MCVQFALQLYSWPSAHVNMVHSAKTELLYWNGCEIASPTWVPGSHAAAADYFSKFLRHCTSTFGNDTDSAEASRDSSSTTLRRFTKGTEVDGSLHFVEIANECDVKISNCNTTWEEMVQLHVTVAQRLHADYGTPSSVVMDGKLHLQRGSRNSPSPWVCGPAAAWPEYEANGFREWHEHMAYFIDHAGSAMDCLSIHLYSYYSEGQLQPGQDSRVGNDDKLSVVMSPSLLSFYT